MSNPVRPGHPGRMTAGQYQQEFPALPPVRRAQTQPTSGQFVPNPQAEEWYPPGLQQRRKSSVGGNVPAATPTPVGFGPRRSQTWTAASSAQPPFPLPPRASTLQTSRPVVDPYCPDGRAPSGYQRSPWNPQPRSLGSQQNIEAFYSGGGAKKKAPRRTPDDADANTTRQVMALYKSGEHNGGASR